MRLPLLPSAAGDPAGTMTAAKEASPQPAVAFRVLFSDGDREIDIGDVAIGPNLAFKKLQFIVSEMIGVSPHQIGLFLIRQKKARTLPEGRRRTPIDEGTDFAAMARERDCVVLAQLKRTRRDRRGRARRNHHGGGGGGGDEFFPLEKNQVRVPEKTILRRPAEFYGGVPAVAAMVPPAENGAGLMGLFNYEGLRNLQLQRERYLLSTEAAAAVAALYPYAGAAAASPYVHDTPRVPGGAPAVCGVCVAAREKPAPFHCCVYDRVVAGGFRSNVGPIERPPKARDQAPA